MSKRKTIGENPLDNLIDNISNKKSSTEVLDANTSLKHPMQQQNKTSKQIITVQISQDVVDRVKNAVYWTPGLTLASLAEKAFSHAVDALENERKSVFPHRKEDLKRGRPII